MAITAFTTMRNPTPFPTMQMAVAVLRVHRQSGIPRDLNFLRQNLLARVIPSKVGALQAVQQAHRIARVEPLPPMRVPPCMRYGQRTNTPFPLTQTVVAVLPQVRQKPTVLILRCPQRNRQEADIPLRGGEHQVLRLPRLISRAASTLPIRLQPCMQFGRVMPQQRIP